MKAFHSTSGRNHLKALPRNGKMLHYFDPAEGASPANPHNHIRAIRRRNGHR